MLENGYCFIGVSFLNNWCLPFKHQHIQILVESLLIRSFASLYNSQLVLAEYRKALGPLFLRNVVRGPPVSEQPREGESVENVDSWHP